MQARIFLCILASLMHSLSLSVACPRIVRGMINPLSYPQSTPYWRTTFNKKTDIITLTFLPAFEKPPVFVANVVGETGYKLQVLSVTEEHACILFFGNCIPRFIHFIAIEQEEPF